jgi:hypothetical protein
MGHKIVQSVKSCMLRGVYCMKVEIAHCPIVDSEPELMKAVKAKEISDHVQHSSFRN